MYAGRHCRGAAQSMMANLGSVWKKASRPYRTRAGPLPDEEEPFPPKASGSRRPFRTVASCSSTTTLIAKEEGNHRPRSCRTGTSRCLCIRSAGKTSIPLTRLTGLLRLVHIRRNGNLAPLQPLPFTRRFREHPRRSRFQRSGSLSSRRGSRVSDRCYNRPP